MHRRDWIKRVGAGTALAVPSVLLGDDESSIDLAIRAAIGTASVKPDTRIELHVPEDAANGAVVPVEVVSGVPGTLKILLFVNNHPRAKVAELDTSNPMLAAQLSTHLQLSQAAKITALVKVNSGWHSNSAMVKTLGESCES